MIPATQISSKRSHHQARQEGRMHLRSGKVKRARLEMNEGDGAGASTSAAAAQTPGDDNQHTGAGGVGDSTGDWEAGASFRDNGFTLTQTRQVRLVEWTRTYSSAYVKQKFAAADDPFVVGMKTPWSYIDFNKWSSCCSPAEFQYICNRYSAIKLVKVELEIFDIQVKEVSTDAAGHTQVENNLTGTVRVLIDEHFTYPYLTDCSQWGHLPREPWYISNLPQYAYCMLNDQNTDYGVLKDPCAFWVLETGKSQMLRCGDHTGYVWHCHTHWRDIFPKGQYIERTFNPLLGSYFKKWYKSAAAGHLYKHPEPSESGFFRRNWERGPFFHTERLGDSTQPDPGDRYQYVVSNPATGRTVRAPGPPMGDLGGGIFPTTSLYSAHSTDQQGGESKYADDELETANGIKGSKIMCDVADVEAGGTEQTFLEEQAMQPGMCYDGRTPGYDFPIWAKLPNTERHVDQIPRIAAFGMRHPPPMVILRTSPTPGAPPTAAFDDTQTEPINSFVNQYASMHVTYKLHFEATSAIATQYNPAQYRNMPDDQSYYIPSDAGNMVLFPMHMRAGPMKPM